MDINCKYALNPKNIDCFWEYAMKTWIKFGNMFRKNTKFAVFYNCPYVQMDKNGQDRAFFGQISRLEPGW